MSHIKKNTRKYKDEFIKLYKDGLSIREISRKYEISKSIISSLIKEEMELRPKSSVLSIREELYQSYLTGLNFNQIAKQFNVNTSSVANVLRKYYDIEKSNRKFEYLLEDFKKEYENGKSLSQISKKYGVSRQTILDYISEEKVKTRNYAEASRNYTIDENYFDELDNHKAYILGLFFAIGDTYSTLSNKYIIDLKLHHSKKDLILKAIKDITNKTTMTNIDSTLILRLNSKKISDRLNYYGINDDKLNIPNELKKYFFDGYFEEKLKISKRYISVHIKFNNVVKDYLFNDLKINEENIRYNSSCNTIIIEKMSEIKKIELVHSQLTKKIDDYIELNNLTNSKWNSYVKKIR